MTVEPFVQSDSGYSALAAIVNAIWPQDPSSAELIQRDDASRKPDTVFGRLVDVRDGQIAAFCNYGQVESIADPGVFFVFPLVHPSWQSQKIGTELYSEAMELMAEHKPDRIRSHAREDNDIATRFLSNRGFKTIMREPISVLDVLKFDATRFDDDTTDVRIVSLAQARREFFDWQERCFALDSEIRRDIPDTAQRNERTLADYVRVFDDTGFDPQGWFIAIDDDEDEWVGLSTIWRGPAMSETFYTDVTGVRRTYRRRGIATSLKLRAIQHVRALGGLRIQTQNEQNNPMLGINERLGFVAGPAWLLLEKRL